MKNLFLTRVTLQNVHITTAGNLDSNSQPQTFTVKNNLNTLYRCQVDHKYISTIAKKMTYVALCPRMLNYKQRQNKFGENEYVPKTVTLLVWYSANSSDYKTICAFSDNDKVV